MENKLSCGECHAQFEKRSQRDQHHQREHQQKVQVSFPDERRTVVVQRDLSTRKFSCPTCNSLFSSPKAIRRHTKHRCIRHAKAISKLRVVNASDDSTLPINALCRLGLTFNETVGLLICDACQYCIGHGAEQVKAHLQRLHRYSDPSVNDLPNILRSLQFISEELKLMYTIGTDEVQTVVEGLPVFSGYSCCVCKYLCRDKRTMIHHITIHQDPSFDSVFLQSLYAGVNLKYFRVAFDPSAVHDREREAFLESELQTFDNFLCEAGTIPSNERLTSPLQQQFQWHNTIAQHSTCSPSALMSICRPPKDSVVDENVFRAISAFFVSGKDLIVTMPYRFRRYVLAAKLDVSEVAKGFSCVNDEGCKYRRHMARVLFMVKACYDKQQEGAPVWNSVNSSRVDTAVLGLYTLCANDNFRPESPRVHWKVRSVLQALYINESKDAEASVEDDFQQFTIYRYIVCASITGGDIGRVEMMAANSITSICAGFVYWARLFVLVCIAHPPDGALGSPMSRTGELLPWIRDGTPTTFNAVLEIMKLGSYLAGPVQGQSPIVYWTSDDYSSLVCNGSEVTKASLRAMASSLVRHIQNALPSELLLGFDTCAVRTQIQGFKFVDSVNTRLDGQWFMTRKENQLVAGPRDFLAYLISCKGYAGLRSSTDRTKWDVRRVNAWLLKCDDFLDCLLMTMHLTFGQPSRATELATFRIRDSNMAFRSVYAIRNRFAFLQVYHKSMSVTGKFKPIARFTPAVINAEVLLYFYLVRPVQAMLHRVAFPNDPDGSLELLDHVFVKAGSVMTPEQLRRSIQRGFARFSTMKLDISSYRHVAVAMMEVHVRRREVACDLLDEQAGHSHNTALTSYARGDNDPSSLTRDQLQGFWLSSLDWHEFLLLDKRKTLLDIGAIPPLRDNRSDLLTKSLEEEKQHSGMLARLEEKVDALTSPAALSSVLERRTFHSTPPSSAFAIAKRVVELFTGGERTAFTIVEQGLALAQLLSDPIQNRLIILPTGGGKSLLYMAFHLLNPRSSKVSVVVVPTVALLDESVLKCKMKAIAACKFSHTLLQHGHHFNIVFVAVEQLSHESLQSFLTILKSQGRLHQFFVDEAHLVVTAASYRPQMLFVPTLSQYGAPMILLSATVPLKMEVDLTTVFRGDFATIRASTNRANIAYRVAVVSNLDAAVLRELENIQNKYAGTKNRCIAYCSTRNEVDKYSLAFVSKTKHKVSSYHAGMKPEQQAKGIAEWRRGTCSVMFATSAFGVGIDFATVRDVIHVGIAWSLLDYIQETGRAGRDGAPCQALTLTSRRYQAQRLHGVQESSRAPINEMVAFLNNDHECRRLQLLRLADGHGLPCLADPTNERCDNCMDESMLPQQVVVATHKQQRLDEITRVNQQRNAFERTIHSVIREFVDSLPPSSCPICWMEKKASRGIAHQCRCMNMKCFKCQFSGHGATACPYKVTFQSGTCYTCGLPWLPIGGVSPLHATGNDNFSKCESPAKGFLLGAAWAFFHKQSAHTIKHLDDIPNSPGEFSQWLSRIAKCSAFTNLLVLFYELVIANGRVNPAGSSLSRGVYR